MAKFLIAFTLFFFLPTPVHADTFWNFVQVECMPEIHTFSIRTFSAYDIFSPGDTHKNLNKLSESNGVYLLSDFAKKKSASCELTDPEHGTEKHTIKVITKSYDAGIGQGMCGAVESANLLVTVDGSLKENILIDSGCADRLDILQNELTISIGGGPASTLTHCVSYKKSNVSPESPIKKGFKPRWTECKTINLQSLPNDENKD